MIPYIYWLCSKLNDFSERDDCSLATPKAGRASNPIIPNFQNVFVGRATRIRTGAKSSRRTRATATLWPVTYVFHTTTMLAKKEATR